MYKISFTPGQMASVLAAVQAQAQALGILQQELLAFVKQAENTGGGAVPEPAEAVLE